MTLFVALAVLCSGAAVSVFLLHKFGQSPIVAYLALGALAGPHGFGLITSGEDVGHTAEIGVVFLLFFIGLEFHLSLLKSMAKQAIIGTLLQSTFTVAAGAAACVAILNASWSEALLLGLCLAFSSTAIVVKAFADRHQADTRAAQVCLAILIGQDLIALVAVAVLPLVFGQESGSSPALKFVMMGLGLPLLFVAAHKLLPFCFRRAALAKDQETFGLASLGACLLVAVAAQGLGASMPLGAFLGGLVFAESPYAHQIRADLALFKNLTLALFFFGVGMLMDVRFALAEAPIILGGVVFVVLAKTLTTWGALRLLREPTGLAASSGLALAQISEFAFVILGIVRPAGIVRPESAQILITIGVVSMTVSPALVSNAIRFGQWFGRKLEGELGAVAATIQMPVNHDLDTEIAVTAQFRSLKAIVVGYGPVGKTACKILIRFGVDPCVIDLNPETVKRLKALGREAVFGDASRREILEAAGIRGAKYLLLTVPDFPARASIITSARTFNPAIRVLSRARYMDEKDRLHSAGADVIAFEEVEVAAELARLFLGELEVRKELIDHEVRRLRSEIATRTGFTQILRRPLDLDPGKSGIFKVD